MKARSTQVNANRNKYTPEWLDYLLAFRLSRTSRLVVVLVVYSLGLVASFFLSYQLRFDFNVPAGEMSSSLVHALWIIPTKLSLLLMIGQFTGLLSYFSIPDLRRLILALGVTCAMVCFVWLVSAGYAAPPRSIIVGDFLLSILFLSGFRLVFRMVRERFFSSHFLWNPHVLRVGIVGAGYAGATLARELSVKRHLGLRPVVFFDDDPEKEGTRVHDIPVIGAPECLLQNQEKLNLQKVIIALPSASGKRIRGIVTTLQEAGIKFETVPTLDQLATGKVKVTQLRPVEIEDLLGRAPVKLETENIRNILQGQTVMVTGAGGSIGGELCRQIASFHPHRLLLVEQSEVQMFQIEQEMISLGYSGLILPLIADVLDYPRMDAVFKEHRPGVVFHAAAHKHVPMMERHPGEAVKNNTLGTAQIAELALEYEVRRFVLISTDKAINPTNVMGATKRLAEIFLQSLAASEPSRTRFMAVRFGNVLGSSGSVIPTFNKQIAAGGPVTVTHPDVTRFFMTIPEAVGLVLQSAAQGQGGEIFVLDMGNPIKIVDLARQLIELSGWEPGTDIEIQFTGLRPGEKLYEELSHEGEDCVPTNHPKIFRFVSRSQTLKTVQERIRELTRNLHDPNSDTIKLLLKKAVPEYVPCLSASAEPAPDSTPTPTPSFNTEIAGQR
ncbi:MAG: hypothetical protein JWM16_2443 [Verrucomicrobiales bacterium]|nr:hypothetical protein [Verrucomicrobiales bacterium]